MVNFQSLENNHLSSKHSQESDLMDAALNRGHIPLRLTNIQLPEIAQSSVTPTTIAEISDRHCLKSI